LLLNEDADDVAADIVVGRPEGIGAERVGLKRTGLWPRFGLSETGFGGRDCVSGMRGNFDGFDGFGRLIESVTYLVADDDDGVFRSMGRFKSGVVSRDFERVRLLLILAPSLSQFRCVVSEKANELTDSPELVSSFAILEFV